MEIDLSEGKILKVLVIRHNVFDYSTSMGKTLSKYFETFQAEDVSQLYIHPEAPRYMPFCHNYYRITDGEAVKSIIQRKNIGTVFNNNLQEIKHSKIDADTSAVYQEGNRRRRCCP